MDAGNRTHCATADLPDGIVLLSDDEAEQVRGGDSSAGSKQNQSGQIYLVFTFKLVAVKT